MNESAAAPLTVWAISDGAAGNARQAVALARALTPDARAFEIGLRGPWRWLAPRLTAGARLGTRGASALRFPWPDIAIGCGRQAALVTRLLRTWSAGTTFTAQILDPRVDPALFDVVVAPRHDQVSGPNILTTSGALHPVDDAWLAQAAADFPMLQRLPPPRTALLVGGPRPGLALDAAWLDTLIAHLQAWLARENGSLLITASRRTPPEWIDRLRGAFRNGCAYLWSGPQDGANPYPGYLAHAERFVVTPDSVNMLSEACATGKPVFTLLPRGAHGKLVAFHEALRERGNLRALDADNSTFIPAPPLRETADVAAEILRRFHARVSGAVPAGEGLSAT
ncbi:MAG TPA: mitochondrial fission ELM1 family protein [Rudaea sp.]